MYKNRINVNKTLSSWDLEKSYPKSTTVYESTAQPPVTSCALLTLFIMINEGIRLSIGAFRTHTQILKNEGILKYAEKRPRTS